MIAPSGEQYEIRSGYQVAVVTEVGATLRSYSVNGMDVVDGFAVDEPSSAGRGQVLAPWPNRLDGGRYTFDGVHAQAAIDEPERGNSIHGLVRWLPWPLQWRSEDAVGLRCILHPQPAYPWRLELSIEYRLSTDGLTVDVRAINRSGAPAPFGIGFHPYVTLGALVDEARLTLPASRRLVTDERALPVGEEVVAGTGFDFVTARLIADTQLDTCFAGLRREDERRCRVRMEAGDRAVEVWADERFGYLQAYTGDTLDPVARRRQAIALEPMTCPPNAFATGNDVIRLEPGEAWSAAWGITPRANA